MPSFAAGGKCRNWLLSAADEDLSASHRDLNAAPRAEARGLQAMVGFG